MSVKLPRVLFSDLTVKMFPETLETSMLLGPLVKVIVPINDETYDPTTTLLRER